MDNMKGILNSHEESAEDGSNVGHDEEVNSSMIIPMMKEKIMMTTVKLI